MGKDPTVKQQKRRQIHHNPLGDEIEADKVAKPLKNRVKLKKAREQDEEEDAEVPLLQQLIPRNS